jgi:hypothetical protein
MYNTQMIERLSAERRSELSKEVHLTRLPKKARKGGSGFGIHHLWRIGGFLGTVGRDLTNRDRSSSAVSTTGLDT